MVATSGSTPDLLFTGLWGAGERSFQVTSRASNSPLPTGLGPSPGPTKEAVTPSLLTAIGFHHHHNGSVRLQKGPHVRFFFFPPPRPTVLLEPPPARPQTAPPARPHRTTLNDFQTTTVPPPAPKPRPQSKKSSASNARSTPPRHPRTTAPRPTPSLAARPLHTSAALGTLPVSQP